MLNPESWNASEVALYGMTKVFVNWDLVSLNTPAMYGLLDEKVFIDPPPFVLTSYLDCFLTDEFTLLCQYK